MAAAPGKEFNFVWEGVDRKGARRKGETQAVSEASVRSLLRGQGIAVLKIRKQSTMFAKQGPKITPKDIAIFTRQLATMLKAGVPLVQSLDIVAKGDANPRMQKLVGSIQAKVEAGNTLTESLEGHPEFFDPLFINLVEAGEKSGALEALLDKVATYKEKTEALKAKIKKAMFYPIAVMVVATIVTGILLIFVVPQFQELFDGFGADLPAFTQFVIGLSEGAQKYWWMAIMTLGAIGYVFNQANRRSAAFRLGLDRVKLKLPVVGEILMKASIARFARTLQTMFAAGVPMVEAMESVAGATGNLVYENAVLKMRDEVSTGNQLQTSMAETGVWTNLSIQMIAIGEESGSLDEMAGKVADFYEQEVDDAVDGLTSLLEPLIMAVIGVLVGGLIIAMYLPIFQLGSVV